MSLFSNGLQIAKAMKKKTNADIADFVGDISEVQISKIVSGRANPKMDAIEKICGSLGMKPSEVFKLGEDNSEY